MSEIVKDYKDSKIGFFFFFSFFALFLYFFIVDTIAGTQRRLKNELTRKYGPSHLVPPATSTKDRIFC